MMLGNSARLAEDRSAGTYKYDEALFIHGSDWSITA